MTAKRGIPGWVWLVAAVPVALIVLGMLASLSVYGVRKYIADARRAEAAAASRQDPPTLEFTGGPIDLSSVMGRARKLADAWQPEAALLSIEATLHQGKIQTAEGAEAKLIFGPSPFAPSPTSGGLFVVIYDQRGIRGAPASGALGKSLPEPMCAPERVLARLTDLGDGPLSLRYARDASERPMWLVSPVVSPERQRLFDPQDCQLHGIVVGPNKR